jgi:hypothetical protein
VLEHKHDNNEEKDDDEKEKEGSIVDDNEDDGVGIDRGANTLLMKQTGKKSCW